MPKKSHRPLFSAERRIMAQRGQPASVQPHPAVDNAEVLAAIAELKTVLENAASAAQPDVDKLPEMSILRGQLHDLKDSIDKTKAEIAALHKPGGDEDKFTTAAMELDAIVRATEEATNNILGAAEDIDERVQEIKERITDVKSIEHLDAISAYTINIFENCNFQDITGQRTGKVVRTINYLEDRILTMINIWGAEEFEGIELPDDARSADEKLLEGPQLEGQGISQDDIDSLFD